ncbi:MAG: hypothetical protein AMXMBFR7_26830 [Planctomycetota bacterium]
MANVRTLSVSIVARTAGFAKGIKQAIGLNKSFSASVKNASVGLAKMSAGFAVAAGAGLAALTKSSMESIDTAAKLSDKLGLSIDSLRGLQYAAGLAGSSSETMNKSLEKMSQNLGNALGGSGEVAEQLKGMGLSAAALVQMDAGEAFGKIADGIRALPTPAQQSAAAMSIFGRAGTELLPTILQGSAALRDQTKEFIGLRGAMSRVDASFVEHANDALTRAGEAVKGLGDRLAVVLAPAVSAVAESFTSWIVGAIPNTNTLNASVERLAQLTGFAADAAVGLAAIWNDIRYSADKASAAALRMTGDLSLLGTGNLGDSYTGQEAIRKQMKALEAKGLQGGSVYKNLQNRLRAKSQFERMADLADAQAGDRFSAGTGYRNQFKTGAGSAAVNEALAGVRARQAEAAAALATMKKSIGGGASPGVLLGKSIGDGIAQGIKMARDHLEEMKGFADGLLESIASPEAKLQDFITKVGAAMRAGLLDATQGAAGIKAEMDRLFPGGETGGRFGAFQQIDLSRVSVGAIASNKPQKVEGTMDKPMLNALKKIEANTKRPPVAVFG